MVVHELAGSGHMVAVVAEVLHDGLGIPQHRILVPLVPEQVLRRVRINPCQKAGPRWCAHGVVAVGAFESHPGTSKPGDVRCSRLRMPTHSGDIVVKVVADKQHNIGLSPPVEDRLGIPARWAKGRHSPYHQALQKITPCFHITSILLKDSNVAVSS